MILDRFGATWVYGVSAFLGSLTSAATALAGGFGGILAARTEPIADPAAA
jgi:hypothetical protein